MAKLNCFSGLIGRKKRPQKEYLEPDYVKQGNASMEMKIDPTLKSCKEEGSNESSFGCAVPFKVEISPSCEVRVFKQENTIVPEAVEMAYEGGDENEDENEISSMKRDFSDLDLHAYAEENHVIAERSMGLRPAPAADRIIRSEGDRVVIEMIQNGHVSDPGIAKVAFWGLPILERSCSYVDRGEVLSKFEDQMLHSNPHSFEDLRSLASGEVVHGFQSSPLSQMSSCSADKVMLKRHSCSQVLPSRNRKLWWKLFLWSHRNLHKPAMSTPGHLTTEIASMKRDGYCSDILETSLELGVINTEARGTTVRAQSPRLFHSESENQNWDTFQRSALDCRPVTEWVAFSSESSALSRVDEWINTLESQSVLPPDDHLCIENGKQDQLLSPEKNQNRAKYLNIFTAEEVLQANSVIRSLNSFSSVAHIAGIGLKVIPNISPFCSLRSANLSSNLIVHITPGSLPKSLHTLNLSRNKISAIDGLRELTRLRILDLSYNRISRIGHGLSNCTLIKELYLVGNKISDVEGIHRLLKLTVLDLSFNKITTSKSLGQLVANYNHLLALNLLGNPIQSNMGDDQLRKTVLRLLPQLAYLNKQPMKSLRVREAVIDSVAKAALRSGSSHNWRKPAKRTNKMLSSIKGRNDDHRRGRHRSNGHHNCSSSRK